MGTKAGALQGSRLDLLGPDGVAVPGRAVVEPTRDANRLGIPIHVEARVDSSTGLPLNRHRVVAGDEGERTHLRPLTRPHCLVYLPG